jgi:hypothetical protein
MIFSGQPFAVGASGAAAAAAANGSADVSAHPAAVHALHLDTEEFEGAVNVVPFPWRLDLRVPSAPSNNPFGGLPPVPIVSVGDVNANSDGGAGALLSINKYRPSWFQIQLADGNASPQPMAMLWRQLTPPPTGSIVTYTTRVGQTQNFQTGNGTFLAFYVTTESPVTPGVPDLSVTNGMTARISNPFAPNDFRIAVSQRNAGSDILGDPKLVNNALQFNDLEIVYQVAVAASGSGNAGGRIWLKGNCMSYKLSELYGIGPNGGDDLIGNAFHTGAPVYAVYLLRSGQGGSGATIQAVDYFRRFNDVFRG